MTAYSTRSKVFFALFGVSMIASVTFGVVKGNGYMLGVAVVGLLASGLGLTISRLDDESLDKILKLSCAR